MAGVRLAALREASGAERRVALVPEVVAKLVAQGEEVLVERGAGVEAFFPDEFYARVGARVVDRAEVLSGAQVLFTVDPPGPDVVAALPAGCVVMGLLGSRTDPDLVAALAARGLTGVDMALLPRTLSRAQTMDALSSQASVAGYRAAIVAAEAFSRYFPMMITAAGTAKPAKVLVLGAGVAGLQAIGTAKRLGAVVTGYDVRPAARGEVESLGATFLEVGGVGDAAGEGGYARELTAAEREAQQAELAKAMAAFDIVITTAQVPGRKPPVLVTEETVAHMAPGAVIVDLAAGPLGGNVIGSVPDARIVTDGGVTLIGAGHLAAQMPAAASAAYARNLAALAKVLIGEAGIAIDLTDELVGAVVVCHDGQIRGADGAARPAAPAPAGKASSDAEEAGGVADAEPAAAPASDAQVDTQAEAAASDAGTEADDGTEGDGPEGRTREENQA